MEKQRKEGLGAHNSAKTHTLALLLFHTTIFICNSEKVWWHCAHCGNMDITHASLKWSLQTK